MLVEISGIQNVNDTLENYAERRRQYKECFINWRDNRKTNIDKIRLLIKGLEETKHTCNIVGLSSAVTGVVGGIVTGIGLITIPFSRKYGKIVIKSSITKYFVTDFDLDLNHKPKQTKIETTGTF